MKLSQAAATELLILEKSKFWIFKSDKKQRTKSDGNLTSQIQIRLQVMVKPFLSHPYIPTARFCLIHHQLPEGILCDTPYPGTCHSPWQSIDPMQGMEQPWARALQHDSHHRNKLSSALQLAFLHQAIQLCSPCRLGMCPKGTGKPIIYRPSYIKTNWALLTWWNRRKKQIFGSLS